MKGDFTRDTFDRADHYSGVRMQQGRVQLDADWNEQIDIQAYRDRTTRQDVIGMCGGPDGDDADGNPLAGFRLTSLGSDLHISAGRYYVHGILTENEEGVPLTEQEALQAVPDAWNDILSGDPLVAGTYLAYLDVWERLITPLDDPDIREVALGGPDTAARTEVVWQVRLSRVGDLDENLICPMFEGFDPDPGAPGLLSARAEPDPEAEKPCVVPPSAGYRRLENQLYRVEIHDGGQAGTATFKWSRENGSIAVRWEDTDGDDLVVSSVGRDDVLGFSPDEWVELTDDRRALWGHPGTLVRITHVDPDARTLTMDTGSATGSILRSDFPENPIVRRWESDGAETVEVPADNGGWIELEDGVEVLFAEGVTYRTGDHWMVPARTNLGDVLWPIDETTNAPEVQTPHGVLHHRCSLGLAPFDGETWGDPTDCRNLFPPLTEINGGCCFRVAPGEDVQQAIDTVIGEGGGSVCLCAGVHRVDGPLYVRNAAGLRIEGSGAATVLHLVGTDDNGEGGLIVSGSGHLEVTGLFIIGANVRAAVDLTERAFAGHNRNIRLHGLTVLNTTMTEPAPACAVRLAEGDRIAIDGCRLLGQVGVLCPSESLPEMEDPRDPDEPNDPNDPDDPADPIPGGPVVVAEEAAPANDPAAVGFDAAGNPVDAVNAPREEVAFAGVRLSRALDQGIDSSRGAGVGAVDIAGTGIRYDAFGIWALFCRSWQIEGVDAQSIGVSLLTNPLVTNLTSATAARVMRVVDREFASASPRSEGTGLAAYLWHGGNIRRSAFAGATGASVLWWRRGEIEDTTLQGENRAAVLGYVESGKLRECRIRSLEGPALSVAAGPRLSVERCRITGPAGLTNLPLAFALGFLSAYVGDVVRIHGLAGVPAGRRRAVRLLLDETVALMAWDPIVQGLRSLFAAAGVSVDPLDVVAAWLERWIGNAKASFPLLLAEFRVEGNDFQTDGDAVELLNFIPLGGFRVDGNEILAAGGQGIRINAAGIAANTDGFYALARWLFEFLDQALANLADGADGTPDVLNEAVSTLATALRGAFASWFRSWEPFLESDHVIADNTVRSTETGIETNLFGAVVSGNTVTLIESPGRANQPIFDPRTSRGIWFKGGGARIDGNRLLVPIDSDPETRAQGGMLFYNTDVTWLALRLVLAVIRDDSDPLWALTETVIQDNAIVGGVGTGVDIYGMNSVNFPAVADVRIRSNEIRRMGRAGIYLEETVRAIAVNIEENDIASCTAEPGGIGPADARGGIVLHNGFLCRIRGNRVSGCGTGVPNSQIFGVDLDTVAGLEMNENVIIGNGATEGQGLGGGVRFQRVIGDVGFRDNEVAQNNGFGLFWQNFSADDGVGLSDAVNAPIGVNASVGFAAAAAQVGQAEGSGIVQGNHFFARPTTTVPVFILAGIASLNVAGNNVTGPSGNDNLIISNISTAHKCAVSNNIYTGLAMFSLDIGSVSQLTVVGNVSDAPIRTFAIGLREAALNIPPVVP